jgi:hypothetical protein
LIKTANKIPKPKGSSTSFTAGRKWVNEMKLRTRKIRKHDEGKVNTDRLKEIEKKKEQV